MDKLKAQNDKNESLIYDFNDLEYSNRNGTYGGLAGLKDGVLICGEPWIIKYPKSTQGMNNVPISYTTAPLNEYIGSHILDILGYDVHKTLLGIREGKIVVACKDFCADNERLLEIRTIKNFANAKLAERLDRSFAGTGTSNVVNIEELFLHIDNNDILTSIPGVKNYFFDLVVGDLFISNNDRNNGNWGIIRNNLGEQRVAPVYDNGGCFTNKADDKKLIELCSESKLLQASTNFRTIYGHEMDMEENSEIKQLNAKNLIEDFLEYEGFCRSLIKIVPVMQYKKDEIRAFVEGIPENLNNLKVCSAAFKNYIVKTLECRLDNMLVPACEKAKEIIEKNSKNEDKNISMEAAVYVHHWSR